jgi:hypothetical protein
MDSRSLCVALVLSLTCSASPPRRCRLTSSFPIPLIVFPTLRTVLQGTAGRIVHLQPSSQPEDLGTTQTTPLQDKSISQLSSVFFLQPLATYLLPVVAWKVTATCISTVVIGRLRPQLLQGESISQPTSCDFPQRLATSYLLPAVAIEVSIPLCISRLVFQPW